MKTIWIITALACCCANGWARTVVANYRNDYKTNAPLTSRWQYLWNAPDGWVRNVSNGDLRSSYLGIPADYVALEDAGTVWTPDGDTDGTNNSPGNYLKLTAAGGHPGAEGNETSSWDRYAIAAFSVPSSGLYAIENSFLSKPSASGDGVEVLVFPGISGAILRRTAPPGGSVDFDVEIGYLGQGMTIYVAFGATATANSDYFDMDFDVVQYPRSDITTQITSAVARGSNVVTVLPGRYYSHANSTHLYFSPIQNVRVQAENVALVCQTPYRAIEFSRFDNVTISGLTVDYDPPVFFQGTIEAITPYTLDVRMHKGYPLPTSGTISDSGIIYESGGDVPMKSGCWTRYPNGMQQLEIDLFRFTTSYVWDNASVGDYFCLRGPQLMPHGIFLDRCVDTTLTSVTLHGAPTFGVFSQRGSGLTFDRVEVVPGPTPLLASVKPLRSSNADGIHVKSASGGVTMTHCRVEYAGDDALVLSGAYAGIIDKPAPNVVTVAFQRQETYTAGDLMKIYVHSNTQRVDRALVSQTTSSLTPAQVQTLTAQYFPAATFHHVTAYDLTLDAPVDAVPGDYLANADQCNRGFLIADNQVKNTRARGILVKASEGTIANNEVENTWLPGLQMRPEPEFWFEADYVADVDVISNRFNRCGIGARNSGNKAGSILIDSTDTSWNAYGNQDILLADNIISNAPGCGIYIRFAANVELRDNLIRNSHEWMADNSTYNQSVVWLETVDNISFTGTNWVCGLGALADRNNLIGYGNAVGVVTGQLHRPFDDLVMEQNPQYVAWKSAYGLVQDADGNDDGDTLMNFAEFALGGNPTNSADTGYAPTVRTTANGFEYVHVQRKFTPVAYSLESTDDLVSGVWTNTAYTVVSTSTMDAEFDVVTNQIPDRGQGNEFIRLRIQQR